MSLMERKVRRYKDEVAMLEDMLPDVADAYLHFTGDCFAAGELDERTKHLIALGVALYAGNEVCTYYYVREARSKGATDRQIMEAAAAASAAAARHIVSQGAVRVQDVLLQDSPTTGVSQAIKPGNGASRMQDDLQDTEFSEAWGWQTQPSAGRGPVSPSF